MIPQNEAFSYTCQYQASRCLHERNERKIEMKNVYLYISTTAIKTYLEEFEPELSQF